MSLIPPPPTFQTFLSPCYDQRSFSYRTLRHRAFMKFSHRPLPEKHSLREARRLDIVDVSHAPRSSWTGQANGRVIAKRSQLAPLPLLMGALTERTPNAERRAPRPSRSSLPTGTRGGSRLDTGPLSRLRVNVSSDDVDPASRSMAARVSDTELMGGYSAAHRRLTDEPAPVAPPTGGGARRRRRPADGGGGGGVPPDGSAPSVAVGGRGRGGRGGHAGRRGRDTVGTLSPFERMMVWLKIMRKTIFKCIS